MVKHMHARTPTLTHKHLHILNHPRMHVHKMLLSSIAQSPTCMRERCCLSGTCPARLPWVERMVKQCKSGAVLQDRLLWLEAMLRIMQHLLPNSACGNASSKNTCYWGVDVHWSGCTDRPSPSGPQQAQCIWKCFFSNQNNNIKKYI